ncbi:hypothetical protein [uncultured Thiodictyon sp.]|uniref:hypothetical protein n=1 Tax=uncultured Thiodictyon sp. TaxID=1846217 RepID=UPI0025EC2661|nr:hypothetical protein [uncultured Thiodictyon sp.]
MNLETYLELLHRNRYEIDDVLVIGPYLTKNFFDRLIELSGHPRELTLLADDGWHQAQLDGIEQLYENRRPAGNRCQFRIIRVAAPNPSGLVHAKIIFFKLTNQTRTYTKQMLLLGSANASEQGFGVHAETFIHIDLADIKSSERPRLSKYISDLKIGRSVDEIWLTLQRASWIYLPEIKVVNAGIRSGFDAWLRRGHLCHKYQPDSVFGRLRLSLRKPIPPARFEANLEPV